LGEFSSIGRLFTLGSFIKITEKALFFLATFFHSKRYAYFSTKKIRWATIWAIFSPTHLVTLSSHNTTRWDGRVSSSNGYEQTWAEYHADRVTRRVCEIIAQNVARSIFCQN
jgi:hypothetical protein